MTIRTYILFCFSLYALNEITSPPKYRAKNITAIECYRNYTQTILNTSDNYILENLEDIKDYNDINYINSNCFFPNSTFTYLLFTIKTCVFGYFSVFQTCFLRAINIVYSLVGDYFIVFNYLFHDCFNNVLQLIGSLIIANYYYGYFLIELLSVYPCNVLIFTYFFTKLVIENVFVQESVRQMLNNRNLRNLRR